jgi:hypothetical protein
MEIACRHCTEKVQVDSFLAAAHKRCPSCRQLLMGEMEPAKTDALPPETAESASQTAGPKTAWLTGLTAGGMIGFIVVMGFLVFTQGASTSTRGTFLGGLTGVILAPLIPIFLHNYMGFAGRMATGVHAGNLATLGSWCVFVPLAMFIGGYLGSHAETIPTSLVIGGTLGGVVLGAIIGAGVGWTIVVPAADAEAGSDK